MNLFWPSEDRIQQSPGLLARLGRVVHYLAALLAAAVLVAAAGALIVDGAASAAAIAIASLLLLLLGRGLRYVLAGE
jgi:hypothetical protein